jgi:hypothetical protein
MAELYARLKKHDPARGCVVRRFTYRGILFTCKQGWVRVPEAVGEYLRGIRQGASPHSPAAFDIATRDEAEAIDHAEAAEREPRRPVNEARPVFPRAAPSSPPPSADNSSEDASSEEASPQPESPAEGEAPRRGPGRPRRGERDVRVS